VKKVFDLINGTVSRTSFMYTTLR